MNIIYGMLATWAAFAVIWGLMWLRDRLRAEAPATDYHTANAAEQFDVTVDEVTPWMRECAKRRAYAEHYRMDMKKFRAMELNETELHMELDELIEEVEQG